MSKSHTRATIDPLWFIQSRVIGPPLSESKGRLLSGISKSIQGLVVKASTEEGQREMAELLGEEDAGRIIGFLTRESSLYT